MFAVTGSHLIKTWRRTHKLPRLHNSVLRLTFGFLLKVGSLSNTFLKICINLYPGNLCYLNTGKFFSEENYTPCRCLKSTVRIIITYYNYHIITTNDHLTRTRTVIDYLIVVDVLVTLDIVAFLRWFIFCFYWSFVCCICVQIVMAEEELTMQNKQM